VKPSEDIPIAIRDASDYRSLVAELSAELDGLAQQPRELNAGAIGRALADPAARVFLDSARTDAGELTARAIEVLEKFRPREAATARSASHEVEILLLQQIDLAWWGGVDDFDTHADLASAPDLIDLQEWRRGGRLGFRYAVASDRLLPRSYKYAVRRFLPQVGPGTPGLSSSYARPQMVSLLNDIAAQFRHRSGAQARPLWINCITRTVVDQCRLQELGFSAHYPSAHCRGWAADIEVAWYERFGLRDALVDLLAGMRADGQINAIDEGRIWHICPHPDTVRES